MAPASATPAPRFLRPSSPSGRAASARSPILPAILPHRLSADPSGSRPALVRCSAVSTRLEFCGSGKGRRRRGEEGGRWGQSVRPTGEAAAAGCAAGGGGGGQGRVTGALLGWSAFHRAEEVTHASGLAMATMGQSHHVGARCVPSTLNPTSKELRCGDRSRMVPPLTAL